jgi:hypothetical protein
MPVDQEAAIAELREVLEEASDALRGSRANLGLSGGPDKASEAIALCRSAIERYTPENSPYRRQVVVLTKGGSNIGVGEKMTGTLLAFIRDFENGRLRSFEEVIHADVSGDYLDQSEALPAFAFILGHRLDSSQSGSATQAEPDWR